MTDYQLQIHLFNHLIFLLTIILIAILTVIETITIFLTKWLDSAELLFQV